MVGKISILPNIKILLSDSSTTGLTFPWGYVWNLFQNFQNNSQKLYTENMPKPLLYQTVF